MTLSTACLVQAKLGLNDYPVSVFDLNTACSGFLYVFQLACGLLNRYEHVLVIGSETLSKIINWDDRSTCVLFGNGTGAMIVTKRQSQLYHYANNEGDLDGVLKTEGPPLVHHLQD